MSMSIPNVAIPICLIVSGLLFMASGATFLLAASLARRAHAPAPSANPEDEWVTGYTFSEYGDALSAARIRNYTGGRWIRRAKVYSYHEGIASTPAGYVVPCIYHPPKTRLNTDAYSLSYAARFWIRILSWSSAPFWWRWDDSNPQPTPI